MDRAPTNRPSFNVVTINTFTPNPEGVGGLANGDTFHFGRRQRHCLFLSLRC